MKTILLILCLFLSGCTQSFEKENIDLDQLAVELSKQSDVLLQNGTDAQLEALLGIDLRQVQDAMLLISPLSYPIELIAVVHTNQPETLRENYRQCIRNFQSQYPMMADIETLSKRSIYGEIGNYSYFIVSEKAQQVEDYLKGM